MRTCFFCSNAADSLEDAWPQWITKQFKGSKAVEFEAERGGVRLKPWRVYRPELGVRCVCRRCNNGWMSQIEVKVQRFLQPMLMGNDCELDLAGQATVALWSVKTAMVLEALDRSDRRAYAQAEREQLRTMSVIPSRTCVWLATSVDGTYFMSTKNRHLDPANGKDISGVSITMAFAHIVLQVLTIRVPVDVGPATHITANVRSGPWDQVTVGVWPTRRSPVHFPPPMGLNGESGLNSLADRFVASTIHEENGIDSIAV
jgi:hypothetical protein